MGLVLGTPRENNCLSEMHAHTTCNWLISPLSIIQALYCRLEQQACYRDEFHIRNRWWNWELARCRRCLCNINETHVYFATRCLKISHFFHNPLVPACFLCANVSAGRDLLLFCSPRWKFTPTQRQQQRMFLSRRSCSTAISYSQFGEREKLCWI